MLRIPVLSRKAGREECQKCIVEMEANLKATFDYIPQSQIRRVYAQLQPGDIVAIATNIAGLDVTHTGLVYSHPDGNIGLIHASPIGKVTISRDLQRYVGNVKNAIGIIVARPIDPLKEGSGVRDQGSGISTRSSYQYQEQLSVNR